MRNIRQRSWQVWQQAQKAEPQTCKAGEKYKNGIKIVKKGRNYLKKQEKLCMIAVVSVSTRTKFKFQEEIRCYYQQQVPAEPEQCSACLFR